MNKYYAIIFTVLFFTMAYTQTNKTNSKPFAIVLHGGAGTILKQNMSDELEKKYLAKLAEALDAGYEVLNTGGKSSDAVVATIKILEDSPLFNAGKGSVFTAEGKNEMDASIMNGKTLKSGAVAGVRKIKNPITAAYCIMQQSEHVMMTGSGAEKFAKKCGCELADSSYFFEEKRFKQLEKIKQSEKTELDHGSSKPIDVEFNDKKFGTVGVVALDKEGNICAGTSTGGMTNKKYGRVGDSPIIGAGTYANNKTCGVSCTGHGEYFIQAVAAYDVSALMEYKGYSLEKAADEVVNKKLKEMGGEGGLVALDAKGNIAMPFNTPGMYRAYKKSDGKMEILIYK